MTEHFSLLTGFALLFLVSISIIFIIPLATSAETNMSSTTNAYAFSFVGINGEPLPLDEFRGKVLLVVNTASACGFTPQYADLEKLYETYKDRGLVVLGVPSNDFGSQEPGNEEQIRQFTETKFHVSFPLTAKTDVVGNARHPFYAWAAEQNKGGFLSAVPHWNFHKYLIDRNGQLMDSFVSTTSPMSSSITSEIETALDK